MDENLVTVSGTVYWYDTHERISGAVIKATSEQGEVKLAGTDDDGDFALDALDPGTWTFGALYEEGRPARPETKELHEDETELTFELFRQMGTADEAAGRRFFVALCAALGVLAIAYVALHALPGLGSGGESAREFFWRAEPWRFLEVLLWAMAGILVNSIITTGSYLRWGRFYREGILMHISHIVTIPLLALVFVLLLSLIKLDVTLTGGNQVQLDLSDSSLLAAVSFLVGSRPWAIWNSIQETARRITGQD